LSADRVGRRFELRIGRDPVIDLAALVERVRNEPGWTIRPPDRLVVQAAAVGADASEDREFSPVAALRSLLDGLPQVRGRPAP